MAQKSGYAKSQNLPDQISKDGFWPCPVAKMAFAKIMGCALEKTLYRRAVYKVSLGV